LYYFINKQDEKTLKSYNITKEDTLQLELRGGGCFTDLSEIPQVFEWSENAPDWRISKMSLFLERNVSLLCEAYNSTVIINMGVPVILKLGLPSTKKPINCPICQKYAKQITCVFNNCEYRYIAIKETNNNGLKKIKSNWQKIEKNYHRFDEKNQTDYSNLLIETRNSNNSLTQEIGCLNILGEIGKKNFSNYSEDNFLCEMNKAEDNLHLKCLFNWFDILKIH
jgi:hypothetical protein